ncbi:unnamed protein product, partial [Porites lobata]
LSGLGEISESLLSDQNLTPADFLDEPLETLKSSQEDCDVYCASPSPVKCNEFKTPLTSRYSNKASVTPSLFSQDESVHLTPVLSLKCNIRTRSQLTCDDDTELVHGSPASPLDTLSRHSSGCDWSKGRTKTPDLLAEIMGQRRSSLYCLLAGSEDDEPAEWSDSMATPPLKIVSPLTAADAGRREPDGQKNADEETTTQEGQPTSKCIARALFSSISINQSVEPLETSLDATVKDNQSLNPHDAAGNFFGTVQKEKVANDSSTIQEYLLEYSSRDESTYLDPEISQNLADKSLVASPLVKKRCRSDTDFDAGSPVNQRPLQSPCSKGLLSPSTRAALSILAQSTPKPSISNTTRSDAMNDDLNLPRDTHLLAESSSLSCLKEQVQDECDVTSRSAEARCSLDTSDLSFGSPSRSFEAAMARETDKICGGEERNSRSSGRGSSLSPITNNHSFHTDVAFNKTARDELTEHPESRPIATGSRSAKLRSETNDFAAGTVMDQGIEAKGCTIEHVSEALSRNRINPTAETATPRSSANDSCKRFRSSSCIASGLRRSSRPKRFLYPTSSHVTKSDEGERSRETTVAVDSLSSPRKDKATTIEKPFQERVNDGTEVRTICCNGATGEKPVTKKLKVDEICEPDRYTAVVYERNGTSKTDDVLFDMDSLSQFPVETLLSPPHANCAKDGLNIWSCSSPKPEMNVTYTIESTERSSSIGKRDLSFHSSERDKCVSDSLNEFTQAKAGGMAAVNRESEREHSVTILREQTPFVNNEHSCYRGNGLVECELQQLGAGEEISSFIKKQTSSSVPAEFLGFSTASGKQVHVSEAAFRKARKTLLEIDTELNLNRSVPTTKGVEPCDGRATNKQRTSARDGDGTLFDCQKLPFKGAGNIVATASTITLDGMKKRKREELPCVVLCTASASANENDDLQNVDEVKTKQTDDYNDSLLEDLLNDCKRKRRDSLKTITEENERIKMVAESTPISEAVVFNSTTLVTDNNLSSERQSSGGFLNIPITAVKTKKNPLFAGKCKNEDNICEMRLKDSSEEHCDKVRETSSLVSNVGRFHSACENNINNNGIPALQTASGKNLQLSEEALNKVASIMYQVDSCDERNVWNDEENGDPLSLKKATFPTRQELSEQGNAKKKESTIKFGGFQTASGEKLMLSTEALQKGVEIMQQIDKSFQTPEKEDSKLSSESMNNRAKTTQGTETCLEGGKRNSASYHPISTAMDDELSKEENGTSISGFQTASGKRVTLSNEALQKAVSIMKQIEKSPTKGNCAPYSKRTGGFSGFQTASGISVKMSREAMEKGAMIMQEIAKSFDESKFHTTSCQSGKTSFAGFQTASGQKVTFSKEALEKSTVIMQQTDRSLAESKDDNASWQRSKTGFSGFQTASGQKVTFSEEALKKGTAIIQQIDRSLAESKENTAYWQSSNTGFSGFQTASGQKVTLSEEALEKGTAIIQQTDKSPEEGKANIASCQRSKTGFSGFQTASGQKVTFSEEALEKGTAIIQQIDVSLEESKAHTASCQRSKPSFSGFQTASGQKVTLSEEALEKGTAIIQQIDKSLKESKANIASCQRSKTGFSGFQTASGQKVTFSEEALEKGTAIIQQIDVSLEESKAHTASCQRSKPSFSGFQTASGQKVTFSKELLEKGTAIIQQIDKSLEESKANPTSCQRSKTCFSGFQTASGQKVTFSEEALEKGTAIMQQIDKCLEESKVNTASCQRSKTVFSGFQTASGRSFELSKEALDKGTVIMKQIDKSLEWSTKSSAVSSLLSRSGFISEFQPESKLSAEKSGETLEKAAKLVNLTDKTFGEKVDKGHPCTTSRSTFSGFQTAAGKSVQISDSALAKARETMASIDSHNCSVSSNLGNPPFHTEPKRNSTAPAVSFEVKGVVMPLPVESHVSEHDQVVTREMLESSEALLADESFMDLSEYLNEKEERSAAERSSFDTSEADVSFEERRTVKRQSGVVFGSNHNLTRRHSSPLQCTEGMFSSRNGMKPRTTTPSGVLHDRRTRSFNTPLRARLARVDNVQSTSTQRRHIDTDCNGSPRSSQAVIPSGLKPKSFNVPRTSTPINSPACRRMRGPRPPFVTPYRKQVVSRNVSPLVRCTAPGRPILEPLESPGAADVEPSWKKPKISSPNTTCNSKSRAELSETDCKVKPQPGFLSQVRRENRRVKIREITGNATPGGFTTAELLELGVSLEVLSVTCSNAGSFRFMGRKYLSEAVLTGEEGARTEDGGVLYAGDDGMVGLEEIKSAFLSTPGVDKQLISEEWIANHYRWIIWKLAAMEVAFPRHFAGSCPWLENRESKDFEKTTKSALKKILECDDVSSRTMILCVTSVSVTANQTEGVSQDQKDKDGGKDVQGSSNKTESSSVIELTDGWYSIRALLDRPLTRLLNDGKLVVGQKLCVYGAELVGSEQAVSPLEAPPSLMLRLHANSTRRALWDAKLGFHRHVRAFPLPLVSLFCDGGFTGCIDVIVLRQYPVQWMEKMPDGTNVFRNSRLEEREAKRFEADRQQRREKLFLQVQEEFEKESGQPDIETQRTTKFRRRSYSSRDLRQLSDGREIYEALTRASDPDAVKECLDERQVTALEEYQRLIQEKKSAELQRKFERVWREQEEECHLKRNVVPLLKVWITDYRYRTKESKYAILSIWRPSEEVMQLLNEGSRLRICHLTAAGVRCRLGAQELQLTASRTTRYEALPIDANVTTSYFARQACSFDKLRSCSSQLCSEVDIVGVVVFCTPLSCFCNSSVQTVYISDDEMNLAAIKFWGGLKAVAVDDLVKPRNFICFSNLTVRSDDRLQCPSLSFGELSFLTLKPREPHLRAALDNLQHKIPDLNLFMANVQGTLTTILRLQRMSPSADVQVTTVRMYGKATHMCSSMMERANHTKRKPSDALNTPYYNKKLSSS